MNRIGNYKSKSGSHSLRLQFQLFWATWLMKQVNSDEAGHHSLSQSIEKQINVIRSKLEIFSTFTTFHYPVYL